jgi:hypothetical protein
MLGSDKASSLWTFQADTVFNKGLSEEGAVPNKDPPLVGLCQKHARFLPARVIPRLPFQYIRGSSVVCQTHF